MEIRFKKFVANNSAKVLPSIIKKHRFYHQLKFAHFSITERTNFQRAQGTVNHGILLTGDGWHRLLVCIQVSLILQRCVSLCSWFFPHTSDILTRFECTTHLFFVRISFYVFMNLGGSLKRFLSLNNFFKW